MRSLPIVISTAGLFLALVFWPANVIFNQVRFTSQAVVDRGNSDASFCPAAIHRCDLGNGLDSSIDVFIGVEGPMPNRADSLIFAVPSCSCTDPEKYTVTHLFKEV